VNKFLQNMRRAQRPEATKAPPPNTLETQRAVQSLLGMPKTECTREWRVSEIVAALRALENDDAYCV
jgi:hypothetical protein